MAGRSGAAQPKMAAGSPTGRLTLTNGLHDYLFIYRLCITLMQLASMILVWLGNLHCHSWLCHSVMLQLRELSLR